MLIIERVKIYLDKIDGSSTMALFDSKFVECLFYGLINFLGTN